MSKIISSPSKRWPGSVKLADPLTFPQLFGFQDALDAARAVTDGNDARLNHALLVGIIPCVEEWNLANFPTPVTPDNFPATPMRAAGQLITWLIRELTELFGDAAEIPND